MSDIMSELRVLDYVRPPTAEEWTRWRELVSAVAPDLYDMLIGDEPATTP